MDSFYSVSELEQIGFKHIGSDIKLSKKASFYNVSQISIGDHTRIDDFAILSGNIMIGQHVHIAAYTSLYAGDAGIFIEDFCNISSYCSIYAISDDYTGMTMTNPTVPDQYKNVIKEKVLIQKHAIIGTHSVVLPGVTIGEGASFGSMSLIKKNAQPWTMYVGAPVRELRPRHKDLLRYEEMLLSEENENAKQ